MLFRVTSSFNCNMALKYGEAACHPVLSRKLARSSSTVLIIGQWRPASSPTGRLFGQTLREKFFNFPNPGSLRYVPVLSAPDGGVEFHGGVTFNLDAPQRVQTVPGAARRCRLTSG